MTTALLPPLVANVSTQRAALILERLEDACRACGATYGLLIDRAGQVVAADGFADHAQATALALRLVPVFLAARSLSRAFREWPIRAILEAGGRLRLVTLPLLDQWLLTMAFEGAGPPDEPARLAEHWMAEFSPLLPERTLPARPRQRAGRIIVRDGVDLIFRADREEE